MQDWKTVLQGMSPAASARELLLSRKQDVFSRMRRGGEGVMNGDLLIALLLWSLGFYLAFLPFVRRRR
jgi:hypothetical protein